MIACYTDRLSVRPGESFKLHASGNSTARLEIARIGKNRKVVMRLDGIELGQQPMPPHPDGTGCDWPAVRSIEVGEDWESGYYDLLLGEGGGQETHHFICVRPPLASRRARALLVLSTNTYHAYNHWGGANAYCDVAALMSGAVSPAEAMAGAIGELSVLRPFAQMLLAPPADVPRLVNLRSRGFREPPWAADPDWPLRPKMSPYDGSAGFLHKWEHAFVAWAEEEGINLDFCTDQDLDLEGDVLVGYSAVLVVGHSEYWSAAQRDRIEDFVDAGGRLAILSGNTAFWKTRYDDDGRTFVCHKWKGFEADPKSAGRPELATHLWSHRAFGRPEAQITGLTFLLGGYHRLGLCVARGQAGYTVYDDTHWALDGTDLFYGDVIGGDIPFLGYENDGCRFRFGDDGLPKALPALGVPENLEIIALAPAAFGEAAGRGYGAIIPPERLDVVARDVHGDETLQFGQSLLRGHAVMASFKRGRGEVFNGGTTEWAHALKAGDPYVVRITRNVLRRFGAYPQEGAP